MKRRYRLALVAVTLAACVTGVAALTALSATSEGPLSLTLRRVGSAVGSAEHAARNRLRGPGRAGELAWFDAYRRDVDRLRRPDSVLLGAYDAGIPSTLDGVIRLDAALGRTVPLIQIYNAWGDKPEQQFPRHLVTAIWDLGSVPLVTWEPWLTDFENAHHANIPLRSERDRHGLRDVARGDYDFYIDAWAAQAAGQNRPLMVRLGHEMNDPYRYPWGPQNNTNDEYIAAWRHVVDRFRAAGATNVLWVWSPHVAYEYWETYYPGDSYVDWVATGVLNFGPIARWSRWWSFDEIFGRKYDQLARFGRPVMIAELGSLAVGGDRAGWYRDALTDLPRKYPAVRSVVFFNVAGDQTVTYQKVDWTLESDTVAAHAVRDAIAPWAPSANGGSRPRGSLTP